MRLEARFRDVAGPELGLEGPERLGEPGLDLVHLIEPIERERREMDGDLKKIIKNYLSSFYKFRAEQSLYFDLNI